MNNPVHKLRRSRGHKALGLTACAGLATAALLSAGALGAGASTSSNTLPTPPKSGPIKVIANIATGVKESAGQGYMVPFAEAPDGAVFFANGSEVEVIESLGAPQVAEHASGTVLSLAASSTDLYVEVGATITDYSRSTGKSVGTWTLPSWIGKPTEGGMFARTGVVWIWTDPATDASGFEYATITALLPGGRTKVVAQNVFPGFVDSDAEGWVYYGNTSNRLVRSNASGTSVVSPTTGPVDSPIAISSGRLVVSSYGAHPVWSNWYLTTLTRFISTKELVSDGITFANTGAGLIGCDNGPDGNTGVLTRLGLSTGFGSYPIQLPEIIRVLEGYYPAVIVNQAGQLHLIRID